MQTETSVCRSPSTEFKCIVCGTSWGEGIDCDSYGICINCFAEWALVRKSCFGNIEQCNKKCDLFKYCQEYHLSLVGNDNYE